jgi:hypothetical protein
MGLRRGFAEASIARFPRADRPPLPPRLGRTSRSNQCRGSRAGVRLRGAPPEPSIWIGETAAEGVLSGLCARGRATLAPSGGWLRRTIGPCGSDDQKPVGLAVRHAPASPILGPISPLALRAGEVAALDRGHGPDECDELSDFRPPGSPPDGRPARRPAPRPR